MKKRRTVAVIFILDNVLNHRTEVRRSVGFMVGFAVFNPAFSGNEHGWTLIFRLGFGMNSDVYLSAFISVNQC